jgi:hypothetical protein
MAIHLGLALIALRAAVHLAGRKGITATGAAFLLCFLTAVTWIVLLWGASPVPRLALAALVGGGGIVSAIGLLRTPTRADLAALARQPFLGERGPSPAVAGGIALALALAAGVLVASHRAAPYAYDAMTYHLFFPARWLQEGRLFVVPTPFGDPAPAYAPSNTELWYLWLLSVTRSDLLARSGQFVYLLLALLAIRGIGRRLALPPVAALAPALLLLVTPTVLRQAAQPEVDLALAALFLAALAFLLDFADSRDGRDLALSGIAAGLFLGTKYVAVVYAPVLVVPLLWIVLGDRNATRARRSALLLGWAALALACGGFWYARNLILTGNPLFPAAVTLAGHTLFDGPITRAEMVRSIFHIHDPSWLPVVAAHAFDPRLALPAAVVWLAGGLLAATGPRRARRLLVWAVPIPLALLWAFAVPYNTQYRFLLPAVGALWVGTGPVWEKRGIARLACAAVLALAALWAFFVATPGLELGRLAFPAVPLIARAAVPGLLGAAVAAWIVLLLAARIGKTRAALVPALFVVSVLVVSVLWRGTPAATPWLRLGLSAPADQPLAAWRYVAKNLRDETIAYAGTNAPYKLAGPQLGNRVVAVDVDGTGRALHEHFAACRAKGDCPPPSDKPTLYRSGEDFAAWRDALHARDVTVLYVQAMGDDERRTIAHDAGGFPVERRWAREHPDGFAPVYASQAVEIFRVVRPDR